MALSIEEGVGHAAANGQLVQLGHQIAQQVELSGNLRSADYANHWALRSTQGSIQSRQLQPHLLARIGRHQVR